MHYASKFIKTVHMIKLCFMLILLWLLQFYIIMSDSERCGYNNCVCTTFWTIIFTVNCKSNLLSKSSDQPPTWELGVGIIVVLYDEFEI